MLLTLHLHTCVISTLKAMLPTPAHSFGLSASAFIVQSATLLEKLLSESFMVLVAGILCNAVIAASPSRLSTGSANAEFLGCHAPRTSLMDTHALPCAVNKARLSLRMQGLLPPRSDKRHSLNAVGVVLQVVSANAFVEDLKHLLVRCISLLVVSLTSRIPLLLLLLPPSARSLWERSLVAPPI